MMNFTDNTKSTEKSCCSDEMKRAIIKAGLKPYTESELCFYLECLIEVINEKKLQKRKGENYERNT